MLVAQLHILRGSHKTNARMRVVKDAADAATFVGQVSERTIFYWRKEFETNGHRFTESLLGKAVHKWIFENKIMAGQAKKWLKKNVGRKAKEGQAFFQIRDFQDYLNNVLLTQWQVPKWKGAKAATRMNTKSEFLQV